MPDPVYGFFQPGSRIQVKKIPDPEVFVAQNPATKLSENYLGCSSQILDPGTDFFPIPDPGSRDQKAPDPGSGFAKLGNCYVYVKGICKTG